VRKPIADKTFPSSACAFAWQWSNEKTTDNCNETGDPYTNTNAY